ncbi:MAG: alpha/beta hydrolase-fold protein [Alistipes communis]
MIPAVDSRFGTVADRTGRAVAGLSMGGHGAFILHSAIRRFRRSGSMSGGVDIRSFPIVGTSPYGWDRKTNIPNAGNRIR